MVWAEKCKRRFLLSQALLSRFVFSITRVSIVYGLGTIGWTGTIALLTGLGSWTNVFSPLCSFMGRMRVLHRDWPGCTSPYFKNFVIKGWIPLWAKGYCLFHKSSALDFSEIWIVAVPGSSVCHTEGFTWGKNLGWRETSSHLWLRQAPMAKSNCFSWWVLLWGSLQTELLSGI